MQMVENGQSALEVGDFEAAATWFERAKEEDAECMAAYVGLGVVYEATGRLGDAEEILMQAVQVVPTAVDVWVALIHLETKYGADEAAADNLSAALRVLPGAPELIALRKAEATVVEDEGSAQLTRLRQLIFEGRIADARALMVTLPMEVDAFTGLMAEAEMCAETGTGDLNGLIHALTREVRGRPNEWEPRSLLGRLMLREGPMQNPRMATGHCEDAFRISGEHPRAGIALIEGWSAVGKTAFALALCKRIADADDGSIECARAQNILNPPEVVSENDADLTLGDDVTPTSTYVHDTD